MRLTRKSVIATAGVIVGVEVVAAILGLSAGWLVALLAVLLVGAAVVLREAAMTPAQPEPVESLVEPVREPQLPSSRAVYDARIQSAASEYQFSFSCTVYWNPIEQPSRTVDLAATAVAAVMRRARQALALMEPSEGVAAKQEIAIALGRAESDDRQQVRAWADNVQVRLPEHFAPQAELRAELRRRQEVNKLERQLEKDFREYLSEDALATPGSATVWWLSKNPDQIEQCVGLYQTLRRLSDAAHDRLPADLFGDRFALSGRMSDETSDGSFERPEEPWRARDEDAGRTVLFAVPERPEETEPPARPGFAEAVEALLDGLEPAQRKLKAFELANLEAAFDNQDGAEAIRTNYDALPIAQELDEPVSAPPVAPEETVPAGTTSETAEASEDEPLSESSDPQATYREQFYSAGASPGVTPSTTDG